MDLVKREVQLPRLSLCLFLEEAEGGSIWSTK
jgi:hypothetical protein